MATTQQRNPPLLLGKRQGFRRSGYLFTTDAIIAAAILIVTAMILLHEAPRQQTDFYTDRMASDVLSVLAHTRVDDICVVSGSSCSCPNYPEFQHLVCGAARPAKSDSLLDAVSISIVTGAATGQDVKDAIHEIFVTKQVIDERRHGFAVLYSTPTSVGPLELYNTETYHP